nr:hypothetical protein [Deltaproteobacteria bacterium]
MPLYLVRWPHLTAALASVPNEDALLALLDEIRNPEGCTWSVYRGPLFIEFDLKADVEYVGKEDRDNIPLQH